MQAYLSKTFKSRAPDFERAALSKRLDRNIVSVLDVGMMEELRQPAVAFPFLTMPQDKSCLKN